MRANFMLPLSHRETMRIYPSLTTVPLRELMRPHTFSTGLAVPKGTLVHLNLYWMHRSRAVWGADAHEFKPERWDASTPKDGVTPTPLHPGAHDFAWAPFGGGQRVCMGQTFSIIEQRVVLAMLLLRFEWTLVGNDAALKGTPETARGMMLHPHGIALKLTRRC